MDAGVDLGSEQGTFVRFITPQARLLSSVRMEIVLSYGRRTIKLAIPKDNLAGLIKPRAPSGRDVRPGLEKALDEPAGEPLEQLAKGRRVCVLIEDDTRAEPHRDIIESLAGRLGTAARVDFILATGSHDPATPGNVGILDLMRRASSDNGLKLGSVHANDCFSQNFADMGKTSRGTPVVVDPVALAADLYVVGADMKNHYFAGYSNALKDFLPGICGYATIEANHAWALDPRSTFGVHPLHPDHSRRNNPLSSDMLEAQRMIAGGKPVFALAMVTSHEKLLWSAAGAMEEVTRRGIAKVDELTAFEVRQAPYVIVSPGGHPEDESLYGAQRALELTKNAVQDGGEVLLLAECVNGIAPNQKAKENFYDRLTKPLNEVLGSIKARYELYSHKAYKFAEMMSRLDSIGIYTSLERDVVERAHFRKIVDPQAVVDGWLVRRPDAKILAFDDANKIAVYAA